MVFLNRHYIKESKEAGTGALCIWHLANVLMLEFELRGPREASQLHSHHRTVLTWMGATPCSSAEGQSPCIVSLGSVLLGHHRAQHKMQIHWESVSGP